MRSDTPELFLVYGWTGAMGYLLLLGSSVYVGIRAALIRTPFQPYAITAAGKRAFSRWLAEAPGRDAIRNPVALRVAFGEQHSGNQLKTLYSGANEYHAEALAMAREQAKEAKKAGDAYGAAALEFAVAYHKAALSWLKVAPAE